MIFVFNFSPDTMISAQRSKLSFYMKKSAVLTSKIKHKKENISLLQREVTKLNVREKTVDISIAGLQKRLRAIEADISMSRRVSTFYNGCTM